MRASMVTRRQQRLLEVEVVVQPVLQGQVGAVGLEMTGMPLTVQAEAEAAVGAAQARQIAAMVAHMAVAGGRQAVVSLESAPRGYA